MPRPPPFGTLAGVVSGFHGARVALLETRHSDTLARLVETYGGRPFAVPALRMTAVDSPRVDRLVNAVVLGRFSVVIFQTGVVAQRLFDEAEQRGVLDAVRERLARCTTVCRGPKPSAVLARYGIKPSANADEPYTTRELLDRLSTLDINRRSVALLHYGERNAALSIALRTRGARLAEFLLYEWQLPEDTAELQQMTREIIDGAVDAIAFTNQIQVRHLYHVTDEMGRADELARALTRCVVVGSIGPSCTHHLRTLGIQPRVMPAIPKMRPLIAALAEYFASARQRLHQAG
jgi:uroporphyrinogen-III synthase